MLYKIDLHIHTPASSCYIDNVMPESKFNTTAQDIVSKATEVGLDAIAITDHNTTRGIEQVIEIGQNIGLRVFPGIELSARGGHILALWDVNAPLSALKELLLQLGFNGSNEGQGFIETELRIDEVFNYIHHSGGLPIAAHIDRRPKGFITSDELSLFEKQKIYQHPYLRALEITIERDKTNWSGGLMGSFQPGRCCIQGSDAHALNEIGRRPIFVEMPDINLTALNTAFKEYNSKVFFPSEIT